MVRYSSCADYTQSLCRQALETTVDLSWVRPGMRIGIKANLVHAAKPEEAATTHPALLTQLTCLLREKGAQVVIGDSPGGLYNEASLNRVYRQCGLTDTGAELNHDFSVKEGTFPEAKVMKRFSYTGWLDSCDAVINFSKLKSHGMMAMTAAVKNFFGAVPGTMKPEYHYRYPNPLDFAHMLVDLQEYFKPRLHIVDAVTCMEGNGPTAGTPRQLGLVLAGENPYEVDQICATLIGLSPEQVLTQKAAAERGLVPDTTFPEALRGYCMADFQVPPTKSSLFKNLLPGKAGELLGKLIAKVLSPRPTAKKGVCIGCGKCQKMCPAKAIVVKNNSPKIRRRACIGCFCCQEFCPKGALEAKRPPIARLLVRQQRKEKP